MGKHPLTLGDFESVIHKHDTSQTLNLSLGWNSDREFVIPDNYISGTVAEGDEIGLEVESREDSIGSGRLLVLEKMTYRIEDRRFGMQRVPGRMAYDLFVRGTDLDISDRTEEDSDFLGQSKFHDFPYWVKEFFGGYDFIFNLELGLESFLEDLYYLGPLRAYPNRIYTRSSVQPSKCWTGR